MAIGPNIITSSRLDLLQTLEAYIDCEIAKAVELPIKICFKKIILLESEKAELKKKYLAVGWKQFSISQEPRGMVFWLNI